MSTSATLPARRVAGLRGWHSAWPLRWHVIALVIAAVLPLVIFAGALLVLDAQKERAAVELRMTTKAAQLASAVDAELQRTVAMLEVLGNAGSLRGADLRQFHAFASKLVQAEPAWADLRLLGADGEALVDARMPFGAALPTLKRADLAAETLRADRPLISHLVPMQDSRAPVSAVFLPVQVGATRYVLAADIDSAHWQRELDSRLPPDMEAVLFDAGGVAIAASNASALAGAGERTSARSSQQAAQAPIIPAGQRLAIEWAAGGGVHRVALNGATSYVAGSRAVRAPWTIVAMMPVEWLDGPLRRSGIALAGGFAGALAVGLLLAASLGRSLAKSISSLVGGVEDVAAARVPRVRRHRVLELERARETLMRTAETMSAQLRREEELRGQLEAHEAARNAFLGVLGHELRNPLAPLHNAVAILKRAGSDSAPVRKATAVLERQTRQLGRLVDDLLDITRIERGKIELRKERVDLSALARNLVADQEGGARQAGITLELHVPTEPAMVYGDPVRLTQVVGNLLNNACKFTPPGGVIQVRVEAQEGVGRVSVKDNGAGIDPAVLRHIFEPFVQGSQEGARVAGGLGLGLALVRALAKMHGGSVSAASEGPGTGAEFVVELPLDREPPAAAGAAPMRSGASSGNALRHDTAASTVPDRPKNMLIVDDGVDGAPTMP